MHKLTLKTVTVHLCQLMWILPIGSTASDFLVFNWNFTILKVNLNQLVNPGGKFVPEKVFDLDPTQTEFVTAMAFDCVQQYIYYAVTNKGIRGVGLDGNNSKEIVHDTEKSITVFGLTVDWINRMLYWTWGDSRTIMVTPLAGLQFAARSRILLPFPLDGCQSVNLPTAIVVIPHLKILVWTVGGNKTEISDLTGRNRTVIWRNPNENGVQQWWLWKLASSLSGKKVYWTRNYPGTGLADPNLVQSATLGSWGKITDEKMENPGVSAPGMIPGGIAEWDGNLFWSTVDVQQTTRIYWKASDAQISVAYEMEKQEGSTFDADVLFRSVIVARGSCPLMQ